MTLLKPVHAITNPVISSDQTGTNYINNVIQNIFSIFIVVGVIYFVWHFIFAGYHFISSQGDPKQIETAKNEVTYALIGLVVIFLVFAILKLIGTIFGIQGLDTLQLTLPSL